MPRRVVGMMASVLLALGCAAGGPAVAGAVTIGIGSNDPSMFSDPRFQALHISTARVVLPWDVATSRADRGIMRGFRAWLRAAEAAHVSPLVSFGADWTSPRADSYAPTVSQYEHAVRTFLRRFPKVKNYTAWNEPDFSRRPLARDRACRELLQRPQSPLSTVHRARRRRVPADERKALPQPRQRTPAALAARLRPGLHHRPDGWALHDYRDVRGHNAAQLRTLTSMTSGPIWLDETGGVLHRGTWRGQSANAAARDERFLFSLAKRFHRIKRIYHYQWYGVPSAGWDSARSAPTAGHARHTGSS